MISKLLAKDVLNRALATGGDYAEIYQQNQINHLVALDYKKVDSVSTSVVSGLGLRIIKGERQVYGYTSNLSRKELFKLAERLSSSFEGSSAITVEELKLKRKKLHHQSRIPFSALHDEKVIQRMKEAEQAAYAVSGDIVNVSIGLRTTDEEIAVFNSEGVIVHDHRPYIRISVSAVAKGNDGSFANHSTSPGAQGGYEFLDSLDLAALGTAAASMAVKKAAAPDSPSGEMTVVIGNAFGGTLFHEACGHPLEAVAIAHNRSTYVGKIGERIASKVVTAIDDGTIEGAWGSINFDDEGHEATKNILIKDGVLKNFMVDRFNGKKLGLAATGSERRESYRYAPTTRMTNTYIANGKSTFEEIIKSVDYGIYCQNFRGGSVDPSTNNFNFSADTVYMIRGGKLAELVKPVILVGYGYDILQKIDMVGDDLMLAPGMCGASSGSVRVQVGQPTVRIKNIIVGGTAKEETR